MLKMFRPLWLLPVLMVFAGCTAAKIPHVIVSDYGKRITSLIAVAPVQSGSVDPRAAEMLRTKLVEELHFKGYPRIPVKAIDGALAEWAARGENLSPQQVGERLRVDAILYATLHESRQGRGIFFASTAVEAAFELRSARTGESLWRTQYRAVHRNYGFTSRSVELKSSQVYEQAMQEVVDRALETLPDASGS
jgi:hypothetical protein